MPKITVTFDVDEDMIKNISNRVDLEDAITQELDWVRQSGLQVEKWHFTENEPKKLFSLCETYEDEDCVRQFNILGVSEDRKMLQDALQKLVEKDKYGFIAEKGVFESTPDFFSTNFEDGFVEYSVVGVDLVKEVGEITKDIDEIIKEDKTSLNNLISCAEAERREAIIESASEKNEKTVRNNDISR